MMHISLYDIEYTITMYLHYRKNYRDLLPEKTIKKLDAEYFGWIANPENQYGDNCLYDQIRRKGFHVVSIEIDFEKPGEFVVWYALDIADDMKPIRLRHRGRADHSGVYDVV